MSKKLLSTALFGFLALTASNPPATDYNIGKSVQQPIVNVSFSDFKALVGRVENGEDEKNNFLARLKVNVMNVINNYPSPFLESDDGVCDFSSDDWKKYLPDNYTAQIIGNISDYIKVVEKSWLVEPVLEKEDVYDEHFFIGIETNWEPVILDGTYRQFLQGGLGEAEKDAARQRLPKIFVGNLEELCNLFKQNKELLSENIINNIKRIDKTSEINDKNVENLVKDLYGVMYKTSL